MKELLKKLVPAGVWRLIRKQIILSDHIRVAALCDSYIDYYFSFAEKLLIVNPKKALVGKKVSRVVLGAGIRG